MPVSPSSHEAWKKVVGLAEEESWPPSAATDPTVWIPAFDEVDFQQEPAVIEVPDTRGTRGRYLRPLGAHTTTGTIRAAHMTLPLLKLLIPHLLATKGDTTAAGGTYYTRADSAPSSLCVYYQRGGVWQAALGCYIRRAEFSFGAQMLAADLEFSGYSVISASAKTPTFSDADTKLFPFTKLTVEIDGTTVGVKDCTIRFNTNVPEADHRSGSIYTQALTQGTFEADIEFTREALSGFWDYIKEGHDFNVKLTMLNVDESAKFIIEAPKVRINPARHDDREDVNLLFSRVTGNALVDITEGYEIRAYIE